MPVFTSVLAQVLDSVFARALDWHEALEVLAWGSSFTCAEVLGCESAEVLGLTSSGAERALIALVEVCVEESTCCTELGRWAGWDRMVEEAGRVCDDVPGCGAASPAGMAWLTVEKVALVSLEVEAVDELWEGGLGAAV